MDHQQTELHSKLEKLPKIKKNIKILANARGIARSAFRRNLVIISETQISILTVPWELQSFTYLVPSIPQLRELLNITPSGREIITTTEAQRQFLVSMKLGKRAKSSSRLRVTKIRANISEFFCLKSQEWRVVGSKTNRAPLEARKITRN